MQRLQKLLQQYPLFLISIPVFIVVHIEQQFHQLIEYRFVYKEILLLFVPPVIMFTLSWLLFRNRAKAGIFSFLLLMIFYFFSDLKDWLHHIAPHIFISTYLFLLPLMMLIIVLTFFYLKRTNATLLRFTYYVNLAFLLFIMGDILQIGISSPANNRDQGDHAKKLSRNYIPCDTCTKPDIYYIVFDAYTSSATLQSRFNYANPVDSLLTSKGFFVVKQSTSNYNLTPFSIASTLNANYLTGLDDSKDFYMNEYMPGLYSVYKNELVPILEKEGYDFINHSIFNIQGYPTTIPTFNLWDMDMLYSRMNIIHKTDMDIGWWIRERLSLPRAGTFIFKEHADRRDNHLAKTLNALSATIHAQSTKPRFVYTHLLIPHPLYSFDAAGKRIERNFRSLTEEEEKGAYVEQLKYTNKVMLQIVNDIFAHDKRPFAIIIQGDHSHKIQGQERFEWSTQFPNFNAQYFYNGNYSRLKDTATNVNTFRILLNTFFRQQLPLLKDTSFVLRYH